MMAMNELWEAVSISDPTTKGYKFTCTRLPEGCKECDERLVNFITQDLEAAHQHSRKNNTAFWISRD